MDSINGSTRYATQDCDRTADGCILATQFARSTIPSPVGQCWVSRFIKRHDDLQSKYNRKYDYQRAKREDLILIRAWFKRVQDTKIQYGILDEDVWNFDETGYQMGVLTTAKVVTGTDGAGGLEQYS